MSVNDIDKIVTAEPIFVSEIMTYKKRPTVPDILV